MVDDILKKYPDDVRVVIKNFPLSFHKQAKMAARYVLAAREQGYWAHYNLYHQVFENYRELKTNEDLPIELATNLGLDAHRLIDDANSPKIINQIEEEIHQLKTSGIPRLSVPKFLIQGKEPAGRSIKIWSEMIEEELKKINKNYKSSRKSRRNSN